jgi:Zn-dependent protease
MFQNIQFNLIQTIILWAVPLLFAITLHEVAHGWVAYKLGDPTAKLLGRLTINPIKHIDPIGTIFLPALTVWLGGFIFGWAKPVPITWRNLKNQRRDVALVAFAGPFSNFLMALIWAGIAKAGMDIEAHHIINGVALEAMGKIGIYANCMLMILNLLPIQPLDGGRIISSILPRKLSYYFDKLEPYGIIILLILLATNLLSTIMIGPFEILVGFIRQVFGLA